MGKMQRDKGKRGELEIAQMLRDAGYRAQRGVQYKGTPDSPDVDTDATFCGSHIHIEVKRTERMRPYEFMDQANADCDRDANQTPVVFMRSNGGRWLVLLEASDFINNLEYYRTYSVRSVEECERPTLPDTFKPSRR